MLGHAGLAAFFTAAGIALLVFSFSTWHNAESHSTALIWLAVAAFAVTATLLGIGVVKRSATEMALTNKRVIVKTGLATRRTIDRKSTRLNSSHMSISYAVFCLKKKNTRYKRLSK